DDNVLSSSGTWIKLNGVDVTRSFFLPTDQAYPCSDGGVDIIGSVTLSSGSNTITAHICDDWGECTDATSGTYTYTPAPVLGSVTVTLTANPTPDDDPDQATAHAWDTNGNPMSGQTFTFSSSNTGVATIASDGSITPVDIGTTTITATDNGVQGSATLTVTTGSVDVVTVQPNASTITVLRTTGASVSTTDNKGHAVTPGSVTWSTTGTISVSPTSGTSTTITGNSVGSGTVTATADGIPGSAGITVNPAPLNQVTVNLSASSVPDDGSDAATPHAWDTNGQEMGGQTFSFSSSNTGVATIASNGVITPVNVGTTTITATDNGVQGSATLTVTTGSVHTVTVNPGQYAIVVEGSTGASVSATDIRGNAVTPSGVTWSATGTVSVSPTSGSTTTIIANSVGSGTVTATANGVQGSVGISVYAAPLDHVTMNLSASSVPDDGSDAATPHAWDTNGQEMSGELFSFSSSNTGVATIASSGAITPVNVGTTTITVTDDGKQASAVLT